MKNNYIKEAQALEKLKDIMHSAQFKHAALSWLMEEASIPFNQEEANQKIKVINKNIEEFIKSFEEITTLNNLEQIKLFGQKAVNLNPLRVAYDLSELQTDIEEADIELVDKIFSTTFISPEVKTKIYNLNIFQLPETKYTLYIQLNCFTFSYEEYLLAQALRDENTTNLFVRELITSIFVAADNQVTEVEKVVKIIFSEEVITNNQNNDSNIVGEALSNSLEGELT